MLLTDDFTSSRIQFQYCHHSQVEPSGTLALLRNGPRLSFCRPSLPAQTYVGEQCSAEELPDPSTAPGDEKCSKQQEPILAAMTETSNAMPTLKRLYIPLVRCDQPDDSPADTQLSKFRKLEPGVEKATGLINNRKSSKLRHDKPNSDDNVINNVGDNNDVRGEAETKVTCFMVPPRGRISDESQAFSSPLCYEAPLVHFPQASPIRRRLPASRISFHRQAFSSPLAIDFLGRSETSSSSSMNNFNHSTILDSGREDITVVHIFHRTIKRKIKFDLYPEEVSDLECFNQMMNLERNTIFGNYWHVYVPNCRLNNSKTFFTEYHEAFVEAALELGEDPVGEALSFMKDFQSKRCPTLQSISNIIAAWQRNKTHCKDQNTNLVCVIMQIFASYPEMAKAYVDSGLLSAILDNRTEQSEYSMFMAALELDFFTRTLCDPFSFRRSLVFSFLSLSKNRKNIECIVNLIKDNIRKLDMAPSSIGEDLHDNASEPCKNVGEAKGKVLFELHRCNQASLRDSELDRVAQDFSHTSAVFPRRCSEGAKVGEIHRESTNTFSAVSKLKAIVSSVNKETHAVASHTAQPTQPHPGASTSTKCLLSSTSEQVKGDGAITTEGAPLPIDSFCVSSSAARVGPDAHKIGRYATLDLGDQPNPMPSTSVTGIFFQQRLLALALECSTTDKVIIMPPPPPFPPLTSVCSFMFHLFCRD